MKTKALIQSIDKTGFYCSRVPGLEPSSRAWSKKVRCPFCEYKTPTFTVNFESGAWKCFHADCGGGDLISFLIRFENVDFRTALNRLRSRTKIDWSAIRKREREQRRKKKIKAWLEWFRELAAMRIHAAAKMAYLYDDYTDWPPWKWLDILWIIDDDPCEWRRLEKFIPGIARVADEIEAEKVRLFEFYGKE